jgi:hypothetical protein
MESSREQFHATFSSLDFGTVVTTTSYQLIEVLVDPSFMMQDYGQAVARDLERRNPIRYQSVEKQLLESDSFKEFGSFPMILREYFTNLAAIRIHAINDPSSFKRGMNELLVTPYIEFALSQVGIVYDLDNGRKFVPCTESPDLTMSMEQLFVVTDSLRVFKSDGVVLLNNAFPKNREGDQEAMSFAMIDGFIKSTTKYPNTAKSYIAAFLGMKLKLQGEFKSLYGVRYDDAEYVKDRLIEELLKW